LKRIILQIFGVILGFVFVLSCEDDKYLSSPDAQLRFSSDTIMFDTVFTTIGSTTRILKVFNTYKEKLLISSVKIGGGEFSNFRMNVNGKAGNEVLDLEIPPKDSIFIFVEVTVDPTGQNMPMVVQDSIEFKTNFNSQKIPIIAWGQDFHLIKSKVLKNETWKNDKPYLVYNYAYVDTLCTLTIEQGTKIHFHKGAGLYVKGKIVVNGTFDDPVIFTSDRLEDSYKNVPEQWNGILLFSGSRGNIINHGHIKNAVIGLQVGTIEHDGFATVSLSNSKIENMSYAGIFSLKSKIYAYNSLIDNCGFYAAALLVGGEYEFYHTTIGNYWGGWSRKPRTTSSLAISNFLPVPKSDGTTVIYQGDLNKLIFANSIIYGNNAVELELGNNHKNLFNYYFDSCILQMPDTFNVSNKDHFNNIWKGAKYDPKFIDVSKKLIFELDTLSPAKDIGSTVYSKLFPFDMKGKDRTADKAPDVGAYERIEKKPK
jgi:hypothetical protein